MDTTYSAGVSPTTRLYADACGWDNNPTSPNYRSCVVSDDKAGGTVTNTYKVTILSRATGASAKEPLSSMMYDFSGSSYHYNADYAASARFANIISPSLAKSFAPKTINPSGTSTLTFTINNPTIYPITNVNFVDNFPSGMALRASPTPTVSYSGCGSSPSPAAGNLSASATSLSFTGISVEASGTCTIIVTAVTATTVGSYVNTTEPLFVDTLNTGSTGSDTLVVQTAPVIIPPSSCTSPTTIATWTMPTSGQGSGGPPPPYTTKAADVATAIASSSGGTPTISTLGNPANSWDITGGWNTIGTLPNAASAPYYQFSVDTTKYGAAAIAFEVRLPGTGDWGNPADNLGYVYSQADSGGFSTVTSGTQYSA